MSAKPILVTGANGTVGRELVRVLAEAGAEVRAGLHRTDDFGPLLAGASSIVLDFDSPATLASACRGVGGGRGARRAPVDARRAARQRHTEPLAP